MFIKLMICLLTVVALGFLFIRRYYVDYILNVVDNFWHNVCGLSFYFAFVRGDSRDYFKNEYLRLEKEREFLENAKAKMTARERPFVKCFMTKEEQTRYREFCREYRNIDKWYENAKKEYEKFGHAAV